MPHGKTWPAKVRREALELYKQGVGPAAIRRWLGVAPSTLKDWAKKAGVLRPSVKPTKAATEARLARLEVERQNLSEVILAKLSKPAAELIRARLTEALEAEELVTQARLRYADAVRFEVQIKGDYAPNSQEVRDAKGSRREALAELDLAQELRLSIHELVGIVTRGVADHLSLEGVDTEQVAGDLIVELKLPRPDPRKADADAVPEGELRERLEK